MPLKVDGRASTTTNFGTGSRIEVLIYCNVQTDYQRQQAVKRRAAGETLAEIAKSYAVDVSTISRLA